MNVDGTLGAKSEKLVKFARCYGAQAVGSDARLISPAGLVDAFLKRRITLKRTDRKTGKMTCTVRPNRRP